MAAVDTLKRKIGLRGIKACVCFVLCGSAAQPSTLHVRRCLLSLASKTGLNRCLHAFAKAANSVASFVFSCIWLHMFSSYQFKSRDVTAPFLIRSWRLWVFRGEVYDSAVLATVYWQDVSRTHGRMYSAYECTRFPVGFQWQQLPDLMPRF